MVAALLAAATATTAQAAFPLPGASDRKASRSLWCSYVRSGLRQPRRAPPPPPAPQPAPALRPPAAAHAADATDAARAAARASPGLDCRAQLGEPAPAAMMRRDLIPYTSSRGLRAMPPALGRRRTASCLRTALFLFLVTFVWLQLHVASLGGRPAPDPPPDASGNDSVAAVLSMVPQGLHKYLTPRPRNASAAGNASDGAAAASGAAAGARPPLNISDIRRSIERYNEQQSVLNEDAFGPVTNDSLVIVVQVHTRITYLRHLIVSLAQARYIETVLLVISHDVYNEELNELVQSVDFCKVIQIFYPYSIQTHPHEFPGESPGDCPRNVQKEQARKLMCNNALYPDLYGHYREAKFTQTKHHWWWKANRVFNQLEVTRNHTGLVLFLEEDHYVAEDFIHVLRLMQNAARNSCQHCNILSLGSYLKTYNYYTDSKKKDVGSGVSQKAVGRRASGNNVAPSWGFQVLPTLYQHYQKADVTPWISSKHNMGMAFNRSTWEDIRRCADFFCTYDDYNWDWSLQHISQGCLAHKLNAVVMKGPRVFHIGECGVHHKKANCESTAVISKVQRVLKYAYKHLYPPRLTLTVTTVPKKQKLRKGNGGWGDLRDHQLCVNMTRSVR